MISRAKAATISAEYRANVLKPRAESSVLVRTGTLNMKGKRRKKSWLSGISENGLNRDRKLAYLTGALKKSLKLWTKQFIIFTCLMLRIFF
jgi:hypothetical protein